MTTRRTTTSSAQAASDRGALSIFAVIITLAVVVFFGGVVDFSQKLAARHDASIAAEEAARAGATRVDRDRAYAGRGFVVDQAAAVRAARAYLRAGGYTGSASAAGPRAIRVRVEVSRPAVFLAVVGIDRLTVQASAVADLVSGVEGDDGR